MCIIAHAHISWITIVGNNFYIIWEKVIRTNRSRSKSSWRVTSSINRNISVIGDFIYHKNFIYATCDDIKIERVSKIRSSSHLHIKIIHVFTDEMRLSDFVEIDFAVSYKSIITIECAYELSLNNFFERMNFLNSYKTCLTIDVILN